MLCLSSYAFWPHPSLVHSPRGEDCLLDDAGPSHDIVVVSGMSDEHVGSLRKEEREGRKEGGTSTAVIRSEVSE